MVEQKYKPLAGFFTLGGILVMVVGILVYFVGNPFKVSLWDETRALIGCSFIFGMGLAMFLLSATISRLEGKIQRLEKLLEQNP
jgi:membrane-bound ClpP family serine protease